MGVAKIGARPWCVRLLGGFEHCPPRAGRGAPRCSAAACLRCPAGALCDADPGRRGPLAGGRSARRYQPALHAVAVQPPRTAAHLHTQSLRLAPGVRVDVADLTAAAEQMHAGGLADAPFPGDVQPRAAAGMAGGLGHSRTGAPAPARAAGPRLPHRRPGRPRPPRRGPRRRSSGDPSRAPARVVPPPPDPPVRRLRQPHGRPDALRGVRHPAPPGAGPHTGARHHGPGRAVPEAAAWPLPAPDPVTGRRCALERLPLTRATARAVSSREGPVTPGPRRPAGEGAVLDPRRQRDDR